MRNVCASMWVGGTLNTLGFRDRVGTGEQLDNNDS